MGATLNFTMECTINSACWAGRNATFLFDRMYYTRTQIFYERVYAPFPKPKNGSLGWMKELIAEQFRYKNSYLTSDGFNYTLVDGSFDFRCRHQHVYIENILLRYNDPYWNSLYKWFSVQLAGFWCNPFTLSVFTAGGGVN